MRDLNFFEKYELLKGLGTTHRRLRKEPYLEPVLWKQRQFKKIGEIIKYAYSYVPFYRELYRSVNFKPEDLRSWEDFRQLPIVTKEMVIENYPDKMIAEGLDRDSLVISRSSGSSGKVLDIAYDSAAMITYMMAGLRLYRMGFAYGPFQKQLYIYTSPYPIDSLFGMFPLIFVPTLAPVQEIIDALIRNKPDLLVCYPSHLKQIASEMTSEERRLLKLRCISVNSEMSTQAERDELSSLFNCPVLDEYSSEELTRIAAQCLHRSYHLFEDINHIEIINPDSVTGVGTIVGTNLHNRAMPMIRYCQNDRARISEEPCECGRTFRKLVDFQGRTNDSFKMPSGRIISSGFLLDATYDFLLSYRDAVKDFCLIQEALHRVSLEIVPDSGWSEAVAASIHQKFTGFLETGVAFEIKTVDECTKTKTGKRNPIICRVK